MVDKKIANKKVHKQHLFYKISAFMIILIAIILSAAFGIILPFKTHPYFLTVAILYVTGTIVLIIAAAVCLATLKLPNKRYRRMAH